VPSCKISSKSNKWFLRYRDFLFSRWPPSDIWDVEIFGFPSGREVYKMHHHTKFHQNRSTAAEILRLTFLARDVSRLCYDVSVCLSVHLSVTKVHWRILANLDFKFRSNFTAHCGRGRGHLNNNISHYASHC